MVQIQRLSKAYPGRRASPITALRGITLSIEAGTLVAVVGPSGCGKSTLLRIIAGLEPPTEGGLWLNGEDVDGTRSDVGLVFQRPTLLPWRTVRQNILLPAEILGIDRALAGRRADHLIEFVGLNGFEHLYPAQLSGGMQQRAGIARALAHDPDLLLLDEPFSSLDALLRERMALELQRIWASTGKTVVLVTHSIPEAVLLGDRVVVLTPRPGRVAADIPIDLPRPRTLEMIETPGFSHYAALVRRALVARDEG